MMALLQSKMTQHNHDLHIRAMPIGQVLRIIPAPPARMVDISRSLSGMSKSLEASPANALPLPHISAWGIERFCGAYQAEKDPRGQAQTTLLSFVPEKVAAAAQSNITKIARLSAF